MGKLTINGFLKTMWAEQIILGGLSVEEWTSFWRHASATLFSGQREHISCPGRGVLEVRGFSVCRQNLCPRFEHWISSTLWWCEENHPRRSCIVTAEYSRFLSQGLPGSNNQWAEISVTQRGWKHHIVDLYVLAHRCWWVVQNSCDFPSDMV